MVNTAFDPDAVMNLADDDDGLVLDLSSVDVNSSGFTPIPKGIYPAQLDSAETGRSRNGNNPMITWIFTVEHNGSQRRMYYHTTLTEKSLPRLKEALIALGPDLDLSNFNPKADPLRLVGRSCMLKIEVAPYNGELRNQVRGVLPAQEASLDFLNDLQ